MLLSINATMALVDGKVFAKQTLKKILYTFKAE